MESEMAKQTFLCIFLLMCFLSIPKITLSQDAKDPCSCSDGAALHSVDSLLACYNDPRCESRKLDLQVALRVKGRSLAEAIQSYLLLSNNSVLTSVEREFYLKKIEQDRKRLSSIKKNITFYGYDEIIEPLYLDFDTIKKQYYRHYNSFNIGYEYVGLDELFQKGFPRIGYLHYRRFGEAPAKEEGLGFYGVHVFGQMQLTNSAEQTSSSDSDDIENTLILSASIFIPLFHSLINYDRSLSDLTGIILNYGARKSSNVDHINSRFYAGFRNAFNPETYIEVLYGYTKGLESERIEINAHLPVYKFEHGSRIFFGGTLNMSPPWDIAVNDPDVIRFYLEWNADFGKIIDGVTSAFGV